MLGVREAGLVLLCCMSGVLTWPGACSPERTLMAEGLLPQLNPQSVRKFRGTCPFSPAQTEENTSLRKADHLLKPKLLASFLVFCFLLLKPAKSMMVELLLRFFLFSEF